MRILEFLAAASKPVTLSELSRAVDVSKSSAHAIIHTLANDGYIDRVDDGYQLTARTTALARPSVDRAKLLEAFHGSARTSTLAASETVLLCVASGRSAVVIAEQTPSARSIQVGVPVGTHLPLHASASGKALMATWTMDAIHIELGSTVLPALTSRTISNLAALLDELEKVRSSGLAESWGEMDQGYVSAARALRSGRDLPQAAMAVIMPIHRAEPEYWTESKDRLRSLARQVEQALA